MRSVAIRVYGRVQGVGFRYHTLQTALSYNIKGIVKNKIDGSVYIEAIGETEKLEQFINWCHQGPSMAYVERVDVNDVVGLKYDNFSIR